MLKFISRFFFTSFLLNFIWEISQVPFYSETGMGVQNNYLEFLKIHWQVSLKDALMVLAVYLLIGFLLRNWQWIKNLNYGWIIFWIVLPAWQAAIEYYSVNLAHRWAYAPAMPLILGIGLIPILQMLILPTLAILFSPPENCQVEL